jgi:uncharacterized protein YjiS (DUF1127 family)
MSNRKENGMDEVAVNAEELRALVEIFRTLRKWRDQRNARLMVQEAEDSLTDEGAVDGT